MAADDARRPLSSSTSTRPPYKVHKNTDMLASYSAGHDCRGFNLSSFLLQTGFVWHAAGKRSRSPTQNRARSSPRPIWEFRSDRVGSQSGSPRRGGEEGARATHASKTIETGADERAPPHTADDSSQHKRPRPEEDSSSNRETISQPIAGVRAHTDQPPVKRRFTEQPPPPAAGPAAAANALATAASGQASAACLLKSFSGCATTQHSCIA